MEIPLQIQDLARHLVTQEAASSTSVEPSDAAVFRVCEKMRRPLRALMGVEGSHSLLSRALRLAGEEAPGLNKLQISGDGALQAAGLKPQTAGEEPIGEGEAVVFIAHLLGLLLLFIGEPLTVQLVTSEILPNLTAYPSSGATIPYEAILNEIEQLQGSSARLDALAEQHPSATGALMCVASSVRNAAVVLAVVVTIKSPKPN